MEVRDSQPGWRSRAEIDLEALRHNVRVAQSFLPDEAAGVIAVVKANAYGHGAVPVSRAIEPLVRALAVANVREAQDLRNAGIRAPLYLLGPSLPDEWSAVVAGGFCAAVSTEEEVRGLAAAAARAGRRLPVHAVIDTGMGRIGALPSEAGSLVRAIGAERSLELDSVASHFPSADHDPDFTREQEGRFRGIVAEMQAAGLTIPRLHIANSAGLAAFPREAGDWARGGLMIYGISPVAGAGDKLRPVLRWVARLSLVRRLPSGHPVSYGRTWRTPAAMRVATVSVGYADGYPLQLSGRGASVLVRGVRCPLLGRVTMDQIVVGIDHLPPDVAPGEEAVLLGPSGAECISANELAARANTIPWDIFTGIGPRVDRVCYSRET